MATIDRLQVSVRWSGKTIIHLTFYRFDVSWLRRTTARDLHIHDLAKVDASLSFDDVEDISMKVTQHVDESSPTRWTTMCSYVIAFLCYLMLYIAI